MKLSYTIARAELRTLFCSPIALIATILFLVQCAYTYFTTLVGCTVFQEYFISMNGLQEWLKEGFYPASLTRSLLGTREVSGDGLIDIAVNQLYLFIPVITMGVISREMNGTFKLLYSSPVRMRQIVLGKYLSLMMYNLMLLAIIVIFCILALIQVKSVDIGLMFSMAVGFYLLACAYSAIGLFMSSLSGYQVVSAIGTFLILAFLNQVGNYLQRIDFIRDLTYFLSIKNRANKLFTGLITSRDVLYYLLVIFMFLAFTVLKLKGAQEVKPWFVKAGRYAMVLVAVLLIGYVSSRPRYIGYWDTTATKGHTLVKEFRQLLEDIGDDTVVITLHTNLLDDNAIKYCLPENRNNYLSELWEPFVRFKPDLVFKYEYYYNYDAAENDSSLFRNYDMKSLEQIAAIKAVQENDIALSWFKSPEEIEKVIDLKSENYRSVIQVTYKGKSEFLRLGSSGLWPYQSNVAATFKRLLIEKPPKIYYQKGNLERSIKKKGEREYRNHSNDKGSFSALINQGFDIDTISADSREIPSDADILVIADPKTSLNAASVARITKYLEKGGNMFILGEPGKQSMLDGLLQPLGVRLMKGQLIQISDNNTPDQIWVNGTNAELLLGSNLHAGPWRSVARHPTILMPGASPVSFSDSGAFSKRPFLMNAAEPGTWYKNGLLNADTIPPVFTPMDGDAGGEYPTLMALTRQVGSKEQRILVSGDADFISNLRLTSSIQPTYALAVYAWLNEGRFPVSFSLTEKLKDIFLNNVDTKEAGILKIVFVYVLPGILVICSAIFLIRRKRR